MLGDLSVITDGEVVGSRDHGVVLHLHTVANAKGAAWRNVENHADP